MLDYEIDETDFSTYSHLSPEEADREAARRQLARMFPGIDEEEFIDIEEGQLMRHTLNRVLDRMTHMTGPAFSMNQTFDLDVFYKAKEEAYDLMLWLESDDSTPMPDSLVYKAPNDENESSENDEEIITKPKETVTYSRRTRGVSLNSKYQKCLELVKNHLASGITRQDSIPLIVEICDLNRATAESYYSKAKAALEKSALPTIE
jgi:hypothetical protein